MSSEVKPKSMTILDKQYVSHERKVSSLETALYEITHKQVFFGTVLQCLDIYYSHQLPTAGVRFDSNNKKWELLINPKWFCDNLGIDRAGTAHRISVLLHEFFHLTHKHILRAPMMKLTPHRRRLVNVAMDMAINQYIDNLPQGCQACPPKDSGAPCTNDLCPGHAIKVEDYFDEVGGKKVFWEKNKSFEHYYFKLIERFQDAEESDDGGDGDAEGSVDGNTKKKGGGSSKGIPKEFDSHDWEDAGGEENDMMDATEDLMKRAMQKRGLAFDKLPGFIQDLLQDIESRRTELNYRQLILSAIKKHASGIDRKHTWSKPSRRFHNIAPGTQIGPLPKLECFIDSSGSISIEEANDFLSIVDSFLKVGSRKCKLGLWHTTLYYNQPYKLGKRVDASVWQSGGTDTTPVLEYIMEAKPDLTIILTDGCYSDVEFERMLPPNTHPPQVLWIISPEGKEDHPLRRLGSTIKIPRTSVIKKDQKL